MSTPRLIGGVLVIMASLFIIVGSVMPWATAQSAFSDYSKGGMEGDGKITIFLGVVALIGGVIILAYEKAWAGALIAILPLIGAFAVGLIDLFDILNKSGGLSSEYVTVSASAGIYLVIIGAVIGIICAFISTASGKPPVQYVCPNCGQPIQKDDAFCKACGYQMRAEARKGDRSG